MPVERNTTAHQLQMNGPQKLARFDPQVNQVKSQSLDLLNFIFLIYYLQFSLSFAYLFPDVDASVDIILYISRYSASSHSPVQCCSPDTCPHPVLHKFLTIFIFFAFLCFGDLSRFLLVLISPVCEPVSFYKSEIT